MWLKQSTAVVLSFGPFVNPTDGVTLVTTLVSAIDHATTGIFLSKNGGALTIRHQAVTASTYDAYGNYIVTLDTTDTNTVGTLRVQFAAAASCLPVWRDFLVLPANSYDAIITASAFNVYKKATAVTAFLFAMVTSAGAAGTGLTVTGTISKDGGAFAAIAGAITEVSGGWYKVDLTGTEMTASEVALTFAATGALTTFVKLRTQN